MSSNGCSASWKSTRDLSTDDEVPTPSIQPVIDLLCRGGKGGFGSLLRGSAKATATDNEDAYRDLSGRRLRVVNAEKKLKDWQSSERQRKAQIIAAKEQKQQQKSEKRKNLTEVSTIIMYRADKLV